MYLAPDVVGKDFIVLRSQEATDPTLLTDGQLLSQLTHAENDARAWGEDAPRDVRLQLTQLLEEVRLRCLRATAPK